MLSAVVVASVLTWVVYRVTALLPPAPRARALLGDAEQLLDLIPPVDPDRDHIRGPGAGVGHRRRVRRLRVPVLRPAEPVVRDLLSDDDIRYVWRHLPLTDVHPAGAARRRGGRGGGGAGRVLADARPAAAPPGRPASSTTWCATPRSSAWIAIGSTTT